MAASYSTRVGRSISEPVPLFLAGQVELIAGLAGGVFALAWG
jgi:hypothetical protein